MNSALSYDMKDIMQVPKLLREMEDQVGGVFSQRDLAHVMGIPRGRTLQARLAGLVRNGYLFRLQKGLYYTETAGLEVLASRMAGEGYVSLAMAMAERGLVGTRPERVVDFLVPQGRSREVETRLGLIRIHVQQPDYHFGFSVSGTVPMANPEKAWIDCCYFHLRGVVMPFHLREDVAWHLLDRERLVQGLARYRNPRFVRFARNLMEGT